MPDSQNAVYITLTLSISLTEDCASEIVNLIHKMDESEFTEAHFRRLQSALALASNESGRKADACKVTEQRKLIEELKRTHVEKRHEKYSAQHARDLQKEERRVERTPQRKAARALKDLGIGNAEEMISAMMLMKQNKLFCSEHKTLKVDTADQKGCGCK